MNGIVGPIATIVRSKYKFLIAKATIMHLYYINCFLLNYSFGSVMWQLRPHVGAPLRITTNVCIMKLITET